MNKYDDIKRFIEKSNMQGIDYKEITDDATTKPISGSMNQWTLIKQVAFSEEKAGPLESGRTTQPTPQAISEDEFTAPAAELAPVATPASQPVVPVSSAILSSGFGLLDSLRETLPPKESTSVTAAPKAEPIAAPPASHHVVSPTLFAQSVTPDSGSGLLDSVRQALPAQAVAKPQQPAYVAPVQTVRAAPAASVPPAPAPERYKQMFKQKAPQVTAASLPRDTPLQPLLEMIASCR
ncbi:MAG: cellulose biosynthesis protein BcsO [Rouxiella aceris]|uniref:cellulose biosynthesis protein BcsO n=1 Tax=Rouxiella aceris TaxID=2703884 RepID=UPI00284F7330|nr:cellulose biosynthesis protein BcsO [Rouxiella aceris]MDR3431179.1 cellulose biosynthesis protein BcsO [Rouxiella aceris]